MFKRFQQGGMMPPQPQGQMMQQGQGGAQLPDEVIQLLMTLPENIRQYLLSLPEDKMMMELQKIMQEKMAQQQGQGQQGAPMPPQGGEQMAPPMMGKYGMKIKAATGVGKLTTIKPSEKRTINPNGYANINDDILSRKEKRELNELKNANSGNKYNKIITLPNKAVNTTQSEPIITPAVTTQPLPVANTIKSDRPDVGKKIVLDKELGTIIDMGDGKIGLQFDKSGAVKELNIRQSNNTPQGNISTGTTTQSQTPLQQGIVSTPAAKTAKKITTAPKTDTTNQGTGTGNNTTKSTNENVRTLNTFEDYPNIKNFVNSDDGYKAIKNNSERTLKNVTSSNNNFKDADKVLKAQFDLETEKENLEKQLSIIDTVPDSMFKFNSRNAEKEKLKSKLNSITAQLLQVEKTINSQSFNSNYSKSKYKEAYDNVTKNKNQDNASKDLLAVASSYKKQRILDKYSSANAINNLNFPKPQAGPEIKTNILGYKYKVKPKKVDPLAGTRTNILGYKYKSGGQLPSALKITTTPKTIIDNKIEMFKSGGKMKLKTCKNGC